MLQIWTAQKGKYNNPDGLDISVKGNHPIGRVFAPTWKMVISIKQGTLTDAGYTDEYHSLMLNSYKNHRSVWGQILKRDKVVLLCYCPKGAFCHRLLLAQYLQRLGGTYCGEL